MFTDVDSRLRKKNKILFYRDSQCLQELIKLIERQKHRTLVDSHAAAKEKGDANTTMTVFSTGRSIPIS